MTTLVRKFQYQQRPKITPLNHDPYGLLYSGWNDVLKAEFAAFREWRITLFNTDRPRRLCQRPSTFENSINTFENYFGYLVNVCHEDPQLLRLVHVTSASTDQTGGNAVYWLTCDHPSLSVP